MEKRGDINPDYTPPEQTTTPVHGKTKQTPAPPPLLKKGETAADVHPTAAEVREGLEDSPQKRLADKAAERLQ